MAEMAEAELIEQLRAQVMSLKSPRRASRSATEATNATTRSLPGHMSDSSTRISRSSRLPTSRRGSAATHSNGEPEVAVVINVGGINYTTSVATLKAIESSYFALMLNGLWEPTRTQEGHMFVDRNGLLFKYVLEYLRGQCHKELDDFQLPDDLTTLKALRREAEFYQLPGLVSKVTKEMQLLDGKDTASTEFSSSPKRDSSGWMDIDIVYSAVSYTHPQFPEEHIQDLTVRVNYMVAQKQADGFRVRDINSGVILDHTKQQPYSMYIQVVVVRERKPGQHSLYPTSPTIQYGRHLRSSSSFLSSQYQPYPATMHQPAHLSLQTQAAAYPINAAPPNVGALDAAAAGYGPELDARYSNTQPSPRLLRPFQYDSQPNLLVADTIMNNQTEYVPQPIHRTQDSQQSQIEMSASQVNPAENVAYPSSPGINSADRSPMAVSCAAETLQQSGSHSQVNSSLVRDDGDPFLNPTELVPGTPTGFNSNKKQPVNSNNASAMGNPGCVPPTAENLVKSKRSNPEQYTNRTVSRPQTSIIGHKMGQGQNTMTEHGAEASIVMEALLSPRNTNHAWGAEWAEERYSLGSGSGIGSVSGSLSVGGSAAQRSPSQNSSGGATDQPTELAQPQSGIPLLNLDTVCNSARSEGRRSFLGMAANDAQPKAPGSGGLVRSGWFKKAGMLCALR